LPGHNGGANWGSSAVDPIKGEFYVVAKNMPTLMRLILSNEEPTAAVGGPGTGGVTTAEQKAKLMADAKAAAAKGPVRYTSPYDFLQSPSNGMTAINTPWSEITAYDLNTGEIKWRIPDGTVTAPSDLNIKTDSGAHMPRGGPLVTAGGLLFVATASDRTVRAYDRETGKVIWSKDLPTGSEGVPATYEVNGRQFIVFPVAAGAGLFPARFGGPAPQRGAAGGGPEGRAAAPGGPEGRAAQGGGRGRGGPPPAPGAYIAYALPKK
jgi:quinoprotein glucose dehydrogenase